MRTWLSACGAAVALMAASAIPATAAGDVLRVCLDEDLPPLSAHHRGAPDRGFDVALAQAVAGRLGRSLQIQWFESKLDEDSSPALEANALLSDGRCSLVGSYALTKDSLVVPGVKTAKLPDFDGATMPSALGDVSGLPRLLSALREHGYDDEALRKLAHENWLRVLRATWQA